MKTAPGTQARILGAGIWGHQLDLSLIDFEYDRIKATPWRPYCYKILYAKGLMKGAARSR
jgi:hypothetical protein